MQTAELLVHFDPKKELILSNDASDYGVGAVLSHKMEDGSERPVGYISRSLNDAERNYSTLEKEALAIIFGVKKFHQFLYGHSFTIKTDHKPLEGLLNEKKGIPTQAAPRIQRWALTLAGYEYKISYKAGQTNGNADALSRLPLPVMPNAVPLPGKTILLMEHMEGTPVHSIKHVKVAPYHPASNGLAERAVRIFKEGFEKMEGGSVKTKLSRFLLSYRTTPHSTTGVPPAELLMKWKLHTQLNQIVPSIANRVGNKQSQHKVAHDHHAREREIQEGQAVYAKDFPVQEDLDSRNRNRENWSRISSSSANGTVIRRHQDHVRSRENEIVAKQATSDLPEVVPVVLPESLMAPPTPSVKDQPDVPRSPLAAPGETPVATSLQGTRPVRKRAKPGYLKDYICEL